MRFQGRMHIFRFFIVNRVFECLIDELFGDLINSKACTKVCKLLNLSDLKKVAKILFKNTKYYKTFEKCMRSWIRSYLCSWIFAPPEGD